LLQKALLGRPSNSKSWCTEIASRLYHITKPLYAISTFYADFFVFMRQPAITPRKKNYIPRSDRPTTVFFEVVVGFLNSETPVRAYLASLRFDRSFVFLVSLFPRFLVFYPLILPDLFLFLRDDGNCIHYYQDPFSFTQLWVRPRSPTSFTFLTFLRMVRWV